MRMNTSPTTLPTASEKAGAKFGGKYLTFQLGDESYAIPVLKVREIIRLTRIRSVPGLPGHVRGVINLRGRIIPVMDLRVRFGLGSAEATEQNCIVVAQVTTQQGKALAMGLIVDAVEEVVNIAAADIEETPEFGCSAATDYLLAMAKIKGVVKAMLDLDRVIKGISEESLPADWPVLPESPTA